MADSCAAMHADCLKLNFPAAFAASLLAWGLIEFPDVSAVQLETTTDC